jgi:cell pole-organizing protein PopZ
MDQKVNEMMATIRTAVETDINSFSGETRGTLMRGALREMRVRMSGDQPPEPSMPRTQARQEELSRLRERILRNVEHNELLAQAQPAPPPPSSYRQQAPESKAKAQRGPRSDFSSIMALPSPADQPYRDAPDLRGGYAQQEPDDMQYFQEQDWGQLPQQPPPPARHYSAPSHGGYDEPLLSGRAEAATEQAFRHLSDSLLNRTVGDRNFEDMTREMLRGMIKQWLDANLAGLVEALVREEIERVARRGR